MFVLILIYFIKYKMDDEYNDIYYEDNVVESTQDQPDVCSSREDNINAIYNFAVKLQKYCERSHLHLFNKVDTIQIIMDSIS